jgi:hypothetical protein
MLAMLLKTLTILFSLCTAGSALAQDDEPAFPLPAETPRAERVVNAPIKMSQVRQPRQGLDRADAMSEPGFLSSAIAMSANPEAWLKALEQARGAAMLNNSSRTAESQIFADQLYSSLDPRFQEAILSREIDPKKTQCWMKAMSDPRFITPALAMLNPAIPMQWMKVTADGRIFKTMQAWFDPKSYPGWMRMSVDTTGNKESYKAAPLFWQPPQRY